MMSLNPFIDLNKARMNSFLNQLCDVGDFYETLEVRCARRCDQTLNSMILILSLCRWINTWRYPKRICKSTLP